ncbi:SCO1860 family LAETG-anchored protein [Streptomyces spiramenti]|uniref:LPXTG cell wall anchor domain-containing protein n=1 Tax=Streptomyces spiramenti TaxID=2720606 RepID=A0ABX1AG53_9ACTN|nr:LPXTG cell wall anchor domain-containing protein [Streptomyces spiramenti]
MYNSAFRRPGPRRAATLIATALLLGSAAPAVATGAEESGEKGKASAAVLRSGLQVSLLNKAVELPLDLTLNEVSAPEGALDAAEKTALTATLDGVDQGKPFHLLRADVASATASVDDGTAVGEVTLVNAAVHVPGLPGTSLIEVESVTARATCTAGEQPEAVAELPATVKVLGTEVAVTVGGTTSVDVPAIGQVELSLAHRETSDTTAAATALDLRVSVNPLALNVAEVEGSVTLAAAACESPEAAPEPEPEPEPEEPGKTPQTGGEEEVETRTPDLAETGGDSRTPVIAAGAAALVAAGGGLMFLRRRAAGRD